MNIKPALLLCGAVLIAAAPVWADRIELKKDPAFMEFSAKSGRSLSPFELFESRSVFGARDPRTTIALGPFFSTSSAFEIHPSSLREIDFHALSFDISRVENTRRGDGDEKNNNAIRKIEGKLNAVPLSDGEPGSLSLLVLGFVAVGFSARRRKLEAIG